MPIVDDDGALAGVMTERALARRYIRESREPSSLADAAAVGGGDRRGARGRAGGRRGARARRARLGAGHGRRLAAGRRSAPGDVVVVGDRADAQRAAIELGVGLLVTSNGTMPTDEVLALAARARDRRRVLAAGQLRDRPHGHALGAVPRADEPRAADRAARRPALRRRRARSRTSTTARRSPSTAAGGRSGWSPAPTSSTREPRRVLLVDHAEQAQSVPGVEQAEIVEILDHHHIGSIETTVPVRRDLRPGRLAPRRW